MVIIHKIEAQGLHTKVDMELVDETEITKSSIILGGILESIVGRVDIRFINATIRKELPFLADGRNDLVFNSLDIHKERKLP